MDTRRQITELAPWFHNLHLPSGEQTCPDHRLGDFPRVKWEAFQSALPDRLDGWSALDIGCNAGFYSFELARRGAQVTAIDVDPHYLRQARWAASLYGLDDRVTFMKGQVYELARTRRTWDIVLFLGVFYHLHYPILALDVVCRKASKKLVFQSLSLPGGSPVAAVPNMGLDDRRRFLHPGWPKLAFIEDRLEDDPTNWWAPNDAASQALLRAMGMDIVSRPAHEIYVCEPSPDSTPRGYRRDNEEYEAIFGPERSDASE